MTIFDPSYLDRLAEYASDDRAFIKKLCGIFIQRAPRTLASLQEKLEAREFYQTKAFAHDLKNLSYQIGAMRLKDQAEAVEKCQTYEDLVGLCSELPTDLELAIAHIKQYCHDHNLNH